MGRKETGKTEGTNGKVKNDEDKKLELELFRRYKHDGDEDARQELILLQKGNVEMLAKRHARWKNGCSFDDLIQEGWIGVMRAIDKFNDELNVPFDYYVKRWAAALMSTHIYNNGRSIRTPTYSARGISKVEAAVDELTEELGHEPSYNDIAKHTGFTKTKVKRLLANNIKTMSLYTPLSSENTNNLSAVLSNTEDLTPAEEFELIDLIEHCDRFIQSSLSDDERNTLVMYFGLYGRPRMTLEAVGKAIGKTKMGIQRIKVRALNKLNEHIKRI